MELIRENIFIRLLIALCIGIFAGYYYPMDSLLLAFSTIVLLLLLISTYRYLPVHFKYKWQYIYGLQLLFAIMLSGYVLVINQEQHGSQYLKNAFVDYITVRVMEDPSPHEQIIKVTAEINGLINGKNIIPASGRCLLFIRKTEKGVGIRYNDFLLCKNTLTPVDNNPNPHAIDYRQILRNKNIYESGFLNDSEYIISGHHQGFDLKAIAIAARNYCVGIMNQYITNQDAAAVCSSLLLGQREQLSNELESAYASAGVIHILAVSGMHVGLIYLLLHLTLKSIGLTKRFRLLSFALIVTGIWFFALMTGLSSSVIRASTMITLVAFGNYLHRPLLTLNILFGSAFILLLFNPLLIFDIGFQLSFSAVLSILILQPKVYELMQTNNPMLDNLMKVLSISIAAQVLTLPLIMYYFHQIPVHFLLANLIVVPVLSFVIYALIGLVMVSAIPLIAIPLGLAISYIVQGVNTSIDFIQSLPFALYHIRTYTGVMMIISFIAIFFLIEFLYYRKAKMLQVSLLLTIALVGMNTFMDMNKEKQHSVQIFQNSQGVIAGVRNNQQVILFYPGKMNLSTGTFERYLKQYFLYENVHEVLYIPYDTYNNFSANTDWFSFSNNQFRTDGCSIDMTTDGLNIFTHNKQIECRRKVFRIHTNNEVADVSIHPLFIPLATK